MPNIVPAFVLSEQSASIQALSLDRDEIKKLLAIFQERLDAAAELDIEKWGPEMLQGRDAEQVAAMKTELRDGYKIYITLKGTGGRQLYGTVDTVFNSPNFPDDVTSVFFDSALWLKNKSNYVVRNSVLLNLDFTRIPVFDFTLQPSYPTPNVSNIIVRGVDPTWVNGVFHEFEQYRLSHESSVAWVHRHTIYDFLVWLIGIPIGFYLCAKADGAITAYFQSAFVQATCFVYLYLAWLIGCRTMFHYARWIWPRVEYRSARNHSLVHRSVWAVLSGGILVSVLYDILKKFVTS